MRLRYLLPVVAIAVILSACSTTPSATPSKSNDDNSSFSQFQTYTFTTLAGEPRVDGTNDGPGRLARFTTPSGIAVDRGGNVYVPDAEKLTVRKIAPAGLVTTVARLTGGLVSPSDLGGAAGLSVLSAIALDGDDNVYVADHYAPTVWKITPAGVVVIFAGDMKSEDAYRPGKKVSFEGAWGMAVDRSGNIFVADPINQIIRKTTPSGEVTTFAGQTETPGSTGGIGSAARFNGPCGLAVDRLGNVFVADNGNHTIRKITPAGEVTTIAGAAGIPGSTDGPGSEARFFHPWGIAVDKPGNLYVTEVNDTIRKITPEGIVSTIGGLAGKSGSVDGIGSAARFDGPQGIAVDYDGNIYVADTYNHIIRKGVPAIPIRR